MEMNELISKINYLSKKSKIEGLTEEEKDLQTKLRKEYINIFKGNLKNHLDNIKIVDKKDVN